MTIIPLALLILLVTAGLMLLAGRMERACRKRRKNRDNGEVTVLTPQEFRSEWVRRNPMHRRSERARDEPEEQDSTSEENASSGG